MTKMQGKRVYGKLVHMCGNGIPMVGDPCPKCQEYAAQQVELALDPPPDYSDFRPSEQGLTQAIESVPGVVDATLELTATPSQVLARVKFEEDAPEDVLQRVQDAIDQVRPAGVEIKIVVRP